MGSRGLGIWGFWDLRFWGFREFVVRWGSEIKALLVVDLGYSGWRKFWELGLGIEVGSIGMGEMVADRFFLTWRRGCVVLALEWRLM